MSGTLIFPITRKIGYILSQNVTCVSFVWCPNSTSHFRTIGLQLQISSYTAHCKNQRFLLAIIIIVNVI